MGEKIGKGEKNAAIGGSDEDLSSRDRELAEKQRAES